jgi:hypothetical protein
MQFGRVIGGGLLVLGIILCVLQVSLYLVPKKEIPDPASKQATQDLPFPGMLGGVLLMGGLIILVSARRGDEQDGKHAVK